ncbi:hypothetical protein U9M48_028953 [Paspalum notatum var. saurae]|uniref:Uncharacterized protein n=1 Tax=Paspalum notatum var. saurae TaxID=547442 RepID=A0AAQ3X0P6_PASNO
MQPLMESNVHLPQQPSRLEIRGMLVGVNLAALDVGSVEEGDFFVRFKVRCKKQDFISNLALVYGPLTRITNKYSSQS